MSNYFTSKFSNNHEESESSELSKKASERFKTKICRTFLEKGECPYKNNCRFAHGVNQLRSTERNMKEICLNIPSTPSKYNKGDHNSMSSKINSTMKHQQFNPSFMSENDIPINGSIDHSYHDTPHLRPVMEASALPTPFRMNSGPFGVPMNKNYNNILTPIHSRFSDNSQKNDQFDIQSNQSSGLFSTDPNKSNRFTKFKEDKRIKNNQLKTPNASYNKTLLNNSSKFTQPRQLKDSVHPSFKLFLQGSQSASSESNVNMNTPDNSHINSNDNIHSLFNAPLISPNMNKDFDTLFYNSHPTPNRNILNTPQEMNFYSNCYPSTQAKYNQQTINYQGPLSTPNMSLDHDNISNADTDITHTSEYSIDSAFNIVDKKKKKNKVSKMNDLNINNMTKSIETINSCLSKIVNEISPDKESPKPKIQINWWNMSQGENINCELFS